MTVSGSDFSFQLTVQLSREKSLIVSLRHFAFYMIDTCIVGVRVNNELGNFKKSRKHRLNASPWFESQYLFKAEGLKLKQKK